MDVKYRCIRSLTTRREQFAKRTIWESLSIVFNSPDLGKEYFSVCGLHTLLMRKPLAVSEVNLTSKSNYPGAQREVSSPTAQTIASSRIHREAHVHGCGEYQSKIHQS